MKMTPFSLRQLTIFFLGVLLVTGGAGCFIQLDKPTDVIPPAPIPSPDSGTCPGGCADGYTCIQECGPPVVSDQDPPPGYYCERTEVANEPRNCPICLASNARIATPSGEVNVKDVREGMTVWSEDANGNRVASKVIAVSRSAAPSSHRVVHLVLDDAREVWVSANHPAVDGKSIGSLQVGDPYDGSRVQSVERVAYWDTETYDILPDSDTGFYWANGVLLGSTLSK